MLFWEEPWESYMASSTSGVTCWHLHAGYPWKLLLCILLCLLLCLLGGDSRQLYADLK